MNEWLAWAPRSEMAHGPAFSGNTAAALNAWADDLDARVLAAMKQATGN